jgi:hypothetical protein
MNTNFGSFFRRFSVVFCRTGQEGKKGRDKT